MQTDLFSQTPIKSKAAGRRGCAKIDLPFPLPSCLFTSAVQLLLFIWQTRHETHGPWGGIWIRIWTGSECMMIVRAKTTSRPNMDLEIEREELGGARTQV